MGALAGLVGVLVLAGADLVLLALVTVYLVLLDLACFNKLFISKSTLCALSLGDTTEEAFAALKSVAELLEVCHVGRERSRVDEELMRPPDKFQAEVDHDLLLILLIFHAYSLPTSHLH